MKNEIILHERILGVILFHLFGCLSGLIYVLGSDTLIHMTKLMITSYNQTVAVESLVIKGEQNWVYGNLIVGINTLIQLIAGCICRVQYVWIAMLEVLLMSFEYGILNAACLCMIVRTIVTFASMKLYRSSIEIGIFGIKIKND